MPRPDDFLVRAQVRESGRTFPCITPTLYLQAGRETEAVGELTRRVEAATKAAVACGSVFDGAKLVTEIGNWISWLLAQNLVLDQTSPAAKIGIFPCTPGGPCGHTGTSRRYFVLEVEGLPQNAPENLKRAVEDGLGATLQGAAHPGQYIVVSRQASEIHFVVSDTISRKPETLGVLARDRDERVRATAPWASARGTTASTCPCSAQRMTGRTPRRRPRAHPRPSR